jgi:site-specific DNA-methyltransferase (adenine-specific)
MSFAMCEMAWTSFKNGAKIYNRTATQLNRIHPTQKPVQLYKWLLQNYAKEGDTILDTHFGSLSIGIACHDLKFDLTAIELDKDYYEMAKKRLINHQKQLTLF